MLGEGVGFSDEIGASLPEDYDFFSLLEGTPLNSTRMWMLVLYGIVRSNGFRDLVEVGVFHGVTTGFLARAAKLNGGRLMSFDVDFRAIARARERMAQLDLSVLFVNADSAAWMPTGLHDFVFIDGDHSYEGVSSDWATWSPRLDLGGVIAFHDTRDERIAQFLVETFPHEKWQFINFPGDCGLALVRKVAL